MVEVKTNHVKIKAAEYIVEGQSNVLFVWTAMRILIIVFIYLDDSEFNV